MSLARPAPTLCLATARQRLGFALHGSGDLVGAVKDFSLDPETNSPDGPRRFLAVLHAGRRELNRPVVDEDAASIVLFGMDDRTGSRGT